jgi:hypothetical protein
MTHKETQTLEFGKSFYPVCNCTTFRFNNPNAEEVEYEIKLIEIRIKDIIFRFGMACGN